MDNDVYLSGLLFYDLVFTGLPKPPTPGEEVWTVDMGSGPGGIANFAVALARLGMRPVLSAAFGDDLHGRHCWDVLEAEGVDLSCSRRFAGWATPVTVALAYDDDRALVTHGATPPSFEVTPPSTAASIVHIAPDSDLDLPGLVFADVGWDPTQQWRPDVLDQLKHCHAFMPNEVEAMAYTRTDTPELAAARLAEIVPIVVVTRGRDGAVAIDAISGEQASVNGDDVVAVDTTGAGDVFGAAFVHATLAGMPLADRLRFANRAASISVQRVGGALAAPRLEEL
ncbi:carbohydrate kinase family protein [Lentzea tibetensis]|uniref:Carbohydrate kinase family protein n=1 Tax=Lentzea tibetensis TaxID=2591470 RepID=A0A563ENT7_9PSEU|nr:carbohydrate kinase family protein [Lentzea tibetensis]TWP49068.1 carbohydrate kinase family protein [Lentzea tibetensis]